MCKFGNKSVLFGYLWVRILKNYCHISNQHPKICIFAKFGIKIKMKKFEPEVPDLGIFLLEFEKTIVIFQISTLKYEYLQNF